MTYIPDVSVCWDGQTKTAELTVDGTTLSGPPASIEDVFETVTALRSRVVELEVRLDAVRSALYRVNLEANR